ncbi:MAG: response regulator transcription factor [Microcoleus sp. PH2017_10_PVI_O_A]|uniref:response regulator transcription factor n=1 Tax=unclassified Microcoleus TaxID=2642155 RepID=UPI001D330F77|nr:MULTISPECIES: response regulator transcription factor [unclassified Microcoleus]TAE80582.1 MAG: DNA-binding response regulator [Oscillatoriales cyanobacterium]MCC3405771.1 response regulator transcription factor [Microcoleus sp. PH2017_10_PVI_O_A]MCC3459924.1 response regulator transcription factor [Microcoleus sp. PH2017_11_PCY_U_A]MCC3478276.1 response regulator transcription factor [Microcoleus sp. PH2017_12_PCY_D_A]MCC3528775.1 response regulator transcription factor [Microcoleus sp. PH
MPLTILVADDDFATRLSITDYLEIAGYSVIAAENGKEALGLVEEFQPHLIVTDITMPEMDGYEFVRRVRTRPAFRLLPVIFLTERTSTQERIRGYQMGCDNFLAKPFDLPELGAVIRSLLDRYALIAQAPSRTPEPEPIPTEAGFIANDQPEADFLTQKPETTDSLRDSYAVRASGSRNTPNLTQREQEVLDLVTEGLSNVQIGDRLHLSHRTIEKHVSSLFRKTESNNRAELVRFAMEHHLVR